MTRKIHQLRTSHYKLVLRVNRKRVIHSWVMWMHKYDEQQRWLQMESLAMSTYLHNLLKQSYQQWKSFVCKQLIHKAQDLKFRLQEEVERRAWIQFPNKTYLKAIRSGVVTILPEGQPRLDNNVLGEIPVVTKELPMVKGYIYESDSDSNSEEGNEICILTRDYQDASNTNTSNTYTSNTNTTTIHERQHAAPLGRGNTVQDVWLTHAIHHWKRRTDRRKILQGAYKKACRLCYIYKIRRTFHQWVTVWLQRLHQRVLKEEKECGMSTATKSDECNTASLQYQVDELKQR